VIFVRFKLDLHIQFKFHSFKDLLSFTISKILSDAMATSDFLSDIFVEKGLGGGA
jgi:hypothetical protein